MAVESTHTLYVNTMVFSIIAAVLSLALLLVMLYMPQVRSFMVGIVVLEVGLVAMILYSIISIYMYEAAQRKKAAETSNQLVSVDTCPDYFVRAYADPAVDSSNKGAICQNGYPSQDGSRKFFFVRRGCSSRSTTEGGCNLEGAGTDAKNFLVRLANYNSIKSNDLCSQVNTVDPAKPFANVPWTDVKSRCTSLSLGQLLPSSL